MATRCRRRLSCALLLLAPCCIVLATSDNLTPHRGTHDHLPATAVIASDAAAAFNAAPTGIHGGGQSEIVDAGGGPLAQLDVDTRPSLLDAWSYSGENELSDLSNTTQGGPRSSTLTNGPEEASETTTPTAPTPPPRRTPPPLPPLLQVLLRTTSAAPGVTPMRPGRPLFPPPARGATPHPLLPKSWFPPARNADPQAGGAAPMPRFGPYFEEGGEGSNVTARLGSTVLLDCKIGMLRDKTVTWLHRKEDAIHLLTVGRQTYSSDSRFSLAYRYPNNWRLQILFVSRRDEGVYECQVATHPPRIRQIFLRVTAPEVKIVDEDFHEVLERYYKAGSQVELTCLASQLERGGGEESSPGGAGVVAAAGESSPALTERGTPGRATGGRVLWRHGDAAITHNTSGRGIWMNISDDGLSASVTLTVRSAKKSDGGNYTCSADGQASATVSIHILNGELPAAVQYGNSTVPFGAVSVILQLWCLVMSLITIKR